MRLSKKPVDNGKTFIEEKTRLLIFLRKALGNINLARANVGIDDETYKAMKKDSHFKISLYRTIDAERSHLVEMLVDKAQKGDTLAILALYVLNSKRDV